MNSRIHKWNNFLLYVILLLNHVSFLKKSYFEEKKINEIEIKYLTVGEKKQRKNEAEIFEPQRVKHTKP